MTRNGLSVLGLKYSKMLKKNGLIRTGVIIGKNDLILGKITSSDSNNLYESLLKTLYNRRLFKDTSIVFKGEKNSQVIKTKISDKYVVIYTLERRFLVTGDKLSGRHGNKGVVSKILTCENMPYALDGTPLDIILNPLGIPSRMNIGQIMESLLGLAGKYLKESYLVKGFSEKNGNLSSKYLVFSKLLEAKNLTKKGWLFDENNPGKTLLFNGFNGRLFDLPVAIGYSYILKLVHMVDDKIHARLLGPYSRMTDQPVKGKKSLGGQRFGEMEVWSLEGFGAAYNLQELLVAKSDNKSSRLILLNSLILGANFPFFTASEVFKVLVLQIQALCFDIIIEDNQSSTLFWLNFYRLFGIFR